MGQAPAWKEGEEYEGRLPRRLLAQGLEVRPEAGVEEAMVDLALRGYRLRHPDLSEDEARQEIREVLEEAAVRGTLRSALDGETGGLAGFLAVREDGSYWVQEDGRYRRRGVATLLVDSLEGSPEWP